jgi:hypothetical protein
MWGYRWGLTAAQIDLLVIDQPLIVYDRKDKNGNSILDAPSKDEIKNVAAQWKAKYGEQGERMQPTTFDFSKFSRL